MDPLKVRLAALNILNALEQSNQTLDNVLDQLRQQDPFAHQRDRALLQKIVFGVLRWRGRLDYIIGSFSRTPLKKIQPEILNILRIGTFQVAYLDRIPVSAAVNTSVEMAKTLAPRWIVRFVNAVLRNVARGHQQIQFPSIDKDPITALAIRKSFPPWIVQRWLKRFELDETVLLCDAINTIPSITLRANTLKIDRNSLLQLLIKQGESARVATHAPDGILLSQPRKPLSGLESYQLGYFQVQDEAAQFVSLLLDPQPGERILDACAGLGGKTGHIAQLMDNDGVIVASDINAEKLRGLAIEMRRLGVTIVVTKTVDLIPNRLAEDMPAFDRILLDAPCSGLGVLRRNPDAKWAGNKKMFAKYSGRQIDLLKSLAPLVKPDGVLVYAVCSTEPEEGEAVIDNFLSGHADFRLDSPPENVPGTTPSFSGHHGMLKTYPHRNNMDGFFAARMRRI